MNNVASITITEAMAASGLSRTRLIELCRKERIKSRKYGPMWILNVDSLQEYLNGRKLGRPKKGAE